MPGLVWFFSTCSGRGHRWWGARGAEGVGWGDLPRLHSGAAGHGQSAPPSRGPEREPRGPAVSERASRVSSLLLGTGIQRPCVGSREPTSRGAGPGGAMAGMPPPPGWPSHLRPELGATLGACLLSRVPTTSLWGGVHAWPSLHAVPAPDLGLSSHSLCTGLLMSLPTAGGRADLGFGAWLQSRALARPSGSSPRPSHRGTQAVLGRSPPAVPRTHQARAGPRPCARPDGRTHLTTPGPRGHLPLVSVQPRPWPQQEQCP